VLTYRIPTLVRGSFRIDGAKWMLFKLARGCRHRADLRALLLDYEGLSGRPESRIGGVRRSLCRPGGLIREEVARQVSSAATGIRKRVIMSAETEPKDIYRRIIEAISHDDPYVLERFIAPDVVDHNPIPG
jgi:hypothetical protein